MTRVGTVYGEALYTLALEECLAGRILSELSFLEQAFRENPDFIRLLCFRGLSRQERCAVLDDCFREKIHPYVLNFLKILTGKGYMKHFSDCREAFETHYNLTCGILPVTATTAVALTPRQTEALTTELSRITEKQIKLQNRVDPNVLGGVRLDYDGKRLDDTLSHRLNALRRALKETAEKKAGTVWN